MVSEVVRKRLKNNKAKGVAAEKRAAAIYGTERYKANTGGPLDLFEFDGHFVQVKSGGTITLSTIFDGLASARAAALPSHGLGAVHVEYGRGGKLRHLICFDPAEWAAYHGYGAKEDAA